MATGNFPGLHVYQDNFVGPIPANGIRQTDMDRLNTAWDNIQHNHGMNITGTPENKQIWNDMLTEGIQRSPTFRDVITGIGSHTDLQSSIEVNLVNQEKQVGIDAYANKQVDLVDLSHLSFDQSATNPQQMTMGEAIVHFLGERVAAANDMAFLDVKKSLLEDLNDNKVNPADPNSPYKDKSQWNEAGKDLIKYHDFGIQVQNSYRAELGQLPVVKQEVKKNELIQTLENPDHTTFQSPPQQVNDFPNWGDFIWNGLKNQPQVTEPLNPSSSILPVEELTGTETGIATNTIRNTILNDGSDGEINNDETASRGNILSQIRSTNAFDPAQHVENTFTSITNPDPINEMSPINHFGSGFDDGQVTAPKISFGGESDNFNTGFKDNFTTMASPAINEGMSASSEFQNPASMMSFNPENSFSSAGEMSSMSPATMPMAGGGGEEGEMA